VTVYLIFGLVGPRVLSFIPLYWQPATLELVSELSHSKYGLTERPWMSFATAQGWPVVRTLRSRATFWLAASVVIGNTVSGRP